jgi:hypothetical protein
VALHVGQHTARISSYKAAAAAAQASAVIESYYGCDLHIWLLSVQHPRLTQTDGKFAAYSWVLCCLDCWCAGP